MPAISLPPTKVLIDEYLRRFGPLDGSVSRVAVRFGASRQLAELMVRAIEANQLPDFDAFALDLTGMNLANALSSGVRSAELQALIDKAICARGTRSDRRSEVDREAQSCRRTALSW